MYACARVLAEAPSFMITCMHACMLACNLTRLVVCMFVLVVYLLCIHASMHTNIDAASMHPCIRACMHFCIQACMHISRICVCEGARVHRIARTPMSTRMYVRVCVCALAQGGMRLAVCICALAHLQACISARDCVRVGVLIVPQSHTHAYAYA